jgi:transcription initiation factor IIF auxiliary subunit
MKKSIIKKRHFYKEFSKDSYNKNKLMVKNMNENNLLDTLKKKFTISKMWNFRILKIQNMYI